MIPLTPLASYVGEPYNQQVFEPQPSTVRLRLFMLFIAKKLYFLNKRDLMTQTPFTMIEPKKCYELVIHAIFLP